jgi:hypothetical protein
MQDPANGIRRTLLQRTGVNNGKKVHGRRRHLTRLVSSAPWARSWDREIRYDAEVVARPHALYRLVEDTLAGDGERGTMVAASKGLPIRSDASRWKITRTLTEGRRARNLS